jgi:hypothetical protein
METLSHILASFDIFQVIINAIPGMFAPLGHAFQTIFYTLRDLVGKEFITHPGLVSGTVVFIFVYLAWSGIARLRRRVSPVPAPARNN